MLSSCRRRLCGVWARWRVPGVSRGSTSAWPGCELGLGVPLGFHLAKRSTIIGLLVIIIVYWSSKLIIGYHIDSWLS